MDKQQDKPMAEACNILEEPNKEIEAITAARAQLGRKLTTELDKAKALQAEIDRRIKTLASLTADIKRRIVHMRNSQTEPVGINNK